METYEVLINGIPHTVQLDKPPAETPGKVGTDSPKNSTPANKAKAPAAK